MAKPTSQQDALAAILQRVDPLDPVEVEADQAAGLTAASDVTSGLNLPPFDNSAMDGFVMRAADTAGAGDDAPVRLDLVGESRAGTPAAQELAQGQAMRISTGAKVPDGADAVLRVERSQVEDTTLLVRNQLPAGNDIRPAGDDVRVGDVVLRAGTPLGAGELAMLASIGATHVSVRSRPRVAIVATGDELVQAGRQLGPGQIHESNSIMLRELVNETGGEVVSLVRRVGDTREETDAAIAQALEGSDVLLLSGGVSKGEHDHVKPALDAIGVEKIFWQIALRPGHPLWFGVLEAASRRKLVFGLPGNPISAYVTYNIFARPALRALAGRDPQPLTATARYNGPRQAKRVGFAQVVRVRLDNQGTELVATPTSGNQKSHALTSAVGVDGLAMLPAESEGLDDGDEVAVVLLRTH